MCRKWGKWTGPVPGPYGEPGLLERGRDLPLPRGEFPLLCDRGRAQIQGRQLVTSISPTPAWAVTLTSWYPRAVLVEAEGTSALPTEPPGSWKVSAGAVGLPSVGLPTGRAACSPWFTNSLGCCFWLLYTCLRDETSGLHHHSYL